MAPTPTSKSFIPPSITSDHMELGTSVDINRFKAESSDIAEEAILQLDRKILHKILSIYFLKSSDLLSARLVCRYWNDIVSSPNQNSETPALLWNKTRLVLTQGQRSSSAWRGWEAFTKLKLNTRFHCPNFTFRRQDLRQSYAKDFFLVHGLFVQDLKLERCILSLITFQEILGMCPNLKALEVIQVPEFIVFSEVLAEPCGGFLAELRNLTSLTLQSSTSTMNSPGATASASAVQNIHPAVIFELLHFAQNLQTIRLIGWGGSSVTDVMGALAADPDKNLSLAHLGFYQISTPFNVKELTSYLLKAEKRTISFFALTFDSKNTCLPLDRPRLKTMVRKFIRVHGQDLIELDLTNCPLDESIFHQYTLNLNKLKKLALGGTEVKDVESISELIPNLRSGLEIKLDAELKDTKEDPEVKVENNPKQRPKWPSYFHTLSWFDNLCLSYLGGHGVFAAKCIAIYFARANLPGWNVLFLLVLALVNILPLVFKRSWRQKVWRTNQYNQYKKFIKEMTSARALEVEIRSDAD